MRFVHALKWSFFSEIAAKSVQPVVFVVLARLLTPKDYGVMASAVMVISFTQIFWEAGMGKALIQRRHDIDDAANAAFWVNMAVAIAIGVLLHLFASRIAIFFFHDGRVAAVLRVMVLQIVLGALSSVHNALLQKEMDFKKLFLVRFATVTLPGILSVPLAWYGFGYWALVAGTLSGQTAQAIILWHMSRWRPKLQLDIRVINEMWGFGIWVGASGLLSWFYSWADSLIVGIYLGGHDLGLYRTGNQFATMVYATLIGPLTPVFYSYLVRMDNDHEKIRHAGQVILGLLIVVAIPVSFMLLAFSDNLAALVFGANWLGVGIVIGVMGLTHGFSWVAGLNGEIYRAMGRPAYETIVPASTLLLYLLVYALSARYGLRNFVWARYAVSVSALLLHLLVFSRVLDISLFRTLGNLFAWSAVGAASMLGAGRYVAGAFDGLLKQTVLGSTIGFCLVLATLYLFERDRLIKSAMAVIRGR